MTASRESIVEALYALLSVAANGWPTVARRLMSPESIGPAASPAMFLLEHQDDFRRQAYNMPPIEEMSLIIVAYNDVGSDRNLIPATPINNFLDAVRDLMRPAPGDGDNTLTLGGLVKACWIDGTVLRASGDITGKAMAIVPVRVLITQ
jgi:hypothetical protein